MELQDKIGREDVVNKICTLVDRLQKDANFCLALDGEWGSGKSFVMQMLEQRFHEHDEYIVIKYDAWKNNFYSDPLIAILYCLLDGIKDYAYTLSGIPEKIKKGMKKNLQTWGNGLIKALKASEGIVAVLWYAIEGIKNIVTATGNLTNHEKLADFRSYQSLLEEVKEKLNDITKFEDNEGRQTKLIILVDEIDRCLPNEQLIVLERLHHLFDVKNCAVIVALNKNAINANFKIQYGCNGVEYLRKFFSYNFLIQTLYDSLLRNLIQDFVDEINSSEKQDYVYTEKEIKPLTTALVNEFERISKNYNIAFNNRDITEYFRKFRVIWEMDKPMNLAFIGFLLLMMLYKLYEEQRFQNYKKGEWNHNSFLTFKFGDNIQITGQESVSYMGTKLSVPKYNDDFCNKVSLFMNSVRYRNDSSLCHWFQTLNSYSFYHLYVCGEGNRDMVEKCFNEIDIYGIINNGNKDER